mmetsp:Transcript_57561/g.125138  ORF Transcript_57561/g.125138 Transcript_57561/m.125138 type:complete len:277 (+) Transcript_57561:11-841(+)
MNSRMVYSACSTSKSTELLLFRFLGATAGPCTATTARDKKHKHDGENRSNDATEEEGELQLDGEMVALHRKTAHLPPHPSHHFLHHIGVVRREVVALEWVCGQIVQPHSPHIVPLCMRQPSLRHTHGVPKFSGAKSLDEVCWRLTPGDSAIDEEPNQPPIHKPIGAENKVEKVAHELLKDEHCAFLRIKPPLARFGKKSIAPDASQHQLPVFVEVGRAIEHNIELQQKPLGAMTVGKITRTHGDTTLTLRESMQCRGVVHTVDVVEVTRCDWVVRK